MRVHVAFTPGELTPAPVGVVVDGSGNVWVSSSAGVVTEYDTSGTTLLTVGATYLKIAAAKAALPASRAFVLGMLCNVLVCIAVWMTLAGRSVVDSRSALASACAASPEAAR